MDLGVSRMAVTLKSSYGRMHQNEILMVSKRWKISRTLVRAILAGILTVKTTLQMISCCKRRNRDDFTIEDKLHRRLREGLATK
jgi:molybdenum cofactor biosynthesis enzyme